MPLIYNINVRVLKLKITELIMEFDEYKIIKCLTQKVMASLQLIPYRTSVCLLCILQFIPEIVLGQDASKTESKVDDDLTIESVVLGPLRIWHLVFIICTILIVVMVIVCCCFDFRIPRTRQEIEESYQKRRINTKYLKYLEKLPTGFVQNNKKLADVEGNRRSKISEDNNQREEKSYKKKISRRDRISTGQTEVKMAPKQRDKRKQRQTVLQDDSVREIRGGGLMPKIRPIGENRPRPSTIAMNKSLHSIPRGDDDQTRY